MKKVKFPKKIYKYMWINPEVIRQDENYYEEIFTKNLLYFPTVKKLNDPFDCMPYISCDGCDNDELIDSFLQRMKKDGKSEENLVQCKEELYSGQVNIRDVFNHNYENRVKPSFMKDRVLSFSDEPLCVLMWAHYANNYRGFCLEFTIDEEVFSKCLFDIKYSKNRQCFTPLDLVDESFDTRKFISVKHDKWRHEGEWRIFGHNVECDKFEYPKNTLSNVILGTRISKEDEDNIKKWSNGTQNNIAPKKLKFAKNSYKLILAD